MNHERPLKSKELEAFKHTVTVGRFIVCADRKPDKPLTWSRLSDPETWLPTSPSEPQP